MLDVAGQLEGQRAARATGAERSVALGAAHQDLGNGGEREDVVDHRRLAEEAVVRGQRRLGPHLTTLALEALEQRRLLAADIGAGADAQLDGAVLEQAVGPRHHQCVLEHGDGARILGTDVDESLARAHREPADDHALEQREGVALHDHAVREGAGVALIGVAHDVLHISGRVMDRAPLDARREARTTAAAQAGGRDRIERRLRTERAGACETLPATMGRVVVPGDGVDDAATNECPARLAREEGMLRRVADAKRMRTAFKKTGLDEAWDISGGDRAVTDATGIGLHLDQGLEPMHAA